MNVDDLRKKSDDDLRVIAGMLGIGENAVLDREDLIRLISSTESGNSGNETTEAPVRKRGRPKKTENVQSKEEVTVPETADETPAPEKRGRAASAKRGKQNAAVVSSEQPDEKQTKRGKPSGSTKNKNVPEKNAENAEERQTVQEEKKEQPETENTGSAAKDTPRPREKKDAAGTADNAKQKRGRPKKSAPNEKEKTQRKEAARTTDHGAAEKEQAMPEQTAETTPAEKAETVNALPGDTEKQSPPEKEAQSARKGTEFFGSEVVGILEIMADGYGFLRVDNFYSGPRDVYVPPVQIKRFNLRTGDLIKGRAKPQKDHSAYQALFYINEINGKTLDKLGKRVSFDQLIPIYPDEKLVLERNPKDLSTRLIDMVAPIGKGQRGMIVSPPKAGKTELMKKIANSISANFPEVVLIVLLIDERPEEVTDMRESVKGTVVSSTFDELPERHIKVSELVLERAQRLVEQGSDVVILMDSLTRLARAYNLTIPPTGRSLSGGLDPGALHKPKKFFGAARNIRGGGSLTIVATALVDTGSRLDDVIFEEFKGTGNMELHLDRKLSEKRIFPAIDISKSGTRKEELLLSEEELNAIYALRKAIANIGAADATEMIVDKLAESKDNASFIANLKLDDK